MKSALDLLLVGASTRALAVSVRRSGFRGRILALDLFADSDQENLCPCWTPGRDLGGARRTATLLRAAAELAGKPGARRDAALELAFSSGMETHPRMLAALERRVRLLGNSAASVHAVRHPETFFAFLTARDIPHPRTYFSRPAGARWGALLWKPRLGGGGVRIRTRPPWPARGGYFQERVGGTPGSVAFVANGARARILGYCRVLSGEAALGAAGLAYSGNLWGPSRSWLAAGARRVLARAVRLLTEQFRLRGLNGIDFILSRGRPLLLEVNPRWTASMELLEEGGGRSLFSLHRRACLEGRLPRRGVMPRREWIGKGIVYARRPVRVVAPELFVEAAARDVPRAGARVRAGAPLCTVVERGASPAACRRRLHARAAHLWRTLDAARAFPAGHANIRFKCLS